MSVAATTITDEERDTKILDWFLKNQQEKKNPFIKGEDRFEAYIAVYNKNLDKLNTTLLAIYENESQEKVLEINNTLYEKFRYGIALSGQFTDTDSPRKYALMIAYIERQEDAFKYEIQEELNGLEHKKNMDKKVYVLTLFKNDFDRYKSKK